MTKARPQYPIERSPLYNLRRKAKLAQLLGASVQELRFLYPDTRYSDFQQAKKDGTLRDVSVPDERLKQIQKRLLRLLQRIETSDWLISGKRKKSYVDNARFHIKANEVVTIDIRKFYDNCRHKHIYSTYLNTFKASPDVAYLLCQITTRSWGLPTGAPTSQLVAFWSYHQAFNQIDAIAQKFGCVFSLYVDDMTFSSQHAIPVPELLHDVSAILCNVGHRIKYSKIEHYVAGSAKLITGTVLDKEKNLRVPNRLRHKIMTDLDRLKSCKLSVVEKDKLSNTLIGRVLAARNIEPGIFPEVMKLAKANLSSNS